MFVLKKALLVLLLPLFAFGVVHKFYVSVTQLTYSEKEAALQVTTRLFIDDFEEVLQLRYGLDAQLATGDEDPMADAYIEKYFRSKFVLRVNGKVTDYRFLGKRFDNDIMVCYLERSGVPLKSMESIEVQNELLTDLFEEQKNIVHMLIGDQKRSFVLVKENNKGMLNL